MHPPSAAGPPQAVAAQDLVGALAARGVGPGSPVALAWSPDGVGLATGADSVSSISSVSVTGSRADITDAVRRLLAGLRPRLVWWSAATAVPLLEAALRPTATWDVAATHRLLHGGWTEDPEVVWATAHGLPAEQRPRIGQLELLGSTGASSTDDGDPRQLVQPDGYLRPAAARRVTDARAAGRWAAAALEVALGHARALAELPDPRRLAAGPRLALQTAWSESAAELLAVELTRAGLPLDRPTALHLLADRIGPRPADEAEARGLRLARDDVVLAALPPGLSGIGSVDLRNPAQVRQLLARLGIDLPDTRSWRLEPFRAAHPVVAALLDWRKAERIATTYGYAWLDRHVGADGRLRGSWHGCDGAGGRMTAQAGLHNLPAELRPAVAAEPGHVLVRADLGQVEPRVLAAVSLDEALTQATSAPDLYAPVAARLDCDRPTAKVAVLAAMYGQTSGTAGQALRAMDRAFPVAMAYLRAADESGRRAQDVWTYGGRRIRTGAPPPVEDLHRAAARGRFARNAVVQGAAAELFKTWAVTVRAALPAGAETVMCLHDELLVHAPDHLAADVSALVSSCLETTADRWAAGSGVRFVADVAVVRRWSDAKGAGPVSGSRAG